MTFKSVIGFRTANRPDCSSTTEAVMPPAVCSRTGKLPPSIATLTQTGLHPEYAARIEYAPVAAFGITTNSPPATVLMRCRITTAEGRRHVLSLAGDILLVKEGDAALGTEYASGKNVMPTSR